MERTDVIVVGAGPTGLFLAGELALRGVQVTVLERLAEPDEVIKAGSINVASAEILDRRGLRPGLQDVQRRLMEQVSRFVGESAAAGLGGGRRFPVAGHFAGMLFRDELVDQSDPALAAHTDVGGAVLVPQRELERVLGEHCERLGVVVRRGAEVFSVAQTDASVSVESSAGEFSAGWLVAADGGRSVVRKQVGIDFVGTDPQLVGYQAVADFEDSGALARGWTWTPHGIYAYGPMPGRILVARFGPQPDDRDAPVTLDELQRVVREVTETEVTLTGLHGRATRWSDNARQAACYRSGRVLLAGDAAHVHSPFSGQGLNLGLGDAANLGWKLAAAVQGWAPDGLLDTYDSERHPIAAQVLDWTRAQVALLRGDVWTRQLRAVVADELLGVPGVMNRMVTLTSGIAQRYDVADSTGASAVGTIVGDHDLATGGRLADHAHDGRFVLVDHSTDGRFRVAVDALADRVAYVADASPELESLLVRPDGVIAWCADPATLDVQLRRWAGRQHVAA